MTSHKGKRPSVRYGRNLPKRSQCPYCDKKGVFTPDRSRWPSVAHFAFEYRECQYCRATWASGSSWGYACRAADERRKAALARCKGAQA